MSPVPRIVGARWRGEGHAARNEPCCDALFIPRTGRLLSGFVICDGAGGTPAVSRSAQLSAWAGWQALQLLLRPNQYTHSQLQRRFLAAFWHSRRPGQIADHTMLACLWSRQHLLIVQVGDSCLLLRRQGPWQLPLAPARGQYVNETIFLRPDTPPTDVGLWWAPARQIDAVVGFSDGLDAAFLSEQQLNSPLADLVIKAHQQHLGWRGYPAWLASSLADPGLAALSDDDRTLAVAARSISPVR